MITLDNYRYYFSKFAISVTGNIEFGGLLSFLGETSSFNIIQFDTDNIVDLSVGQHEGTTGLSFSIPIVSAQEPKYGLNLFEESNPSDFVLNLGQAAEAVADTNDLTVSQVTFTWIDPSANIASIETVPIASGLAQSTFSPDEVGTWTIEADFGNGVVLVQTLHIDFLVIPESPIGILALVGSSIAALGAFTFLRKRHTGYRATNLGI